MNVNPAVSTNRLRYRPEIDGLRALAILPVVFFHYLIPGFGGGFVGVDVFFVVSGYLITRLIEIERAERRFSFAKFYERRIRRIFPALFVVLAASSVAAAIVLFPVDLVRYANSLLATAGFASNFEFWRETGYFDVIAAEKPLLHLWSIAVEEQFYLIFPVVLMALGSSTRRLKIAGIGAIFTASFAFALWGVAHAPSAAFYLLPSRAWELMLGALLALGALPQIRHRWAREAMASGGIAMIAGAVFVFSKDTPFPGLAALLPCVGTGFVIYAAGRSTDGTATEKILAAPPLVFVGKISYSLYLWHWPLFVYARYLAYRNPPPGETLLLIALSFALATCSWFLVERPFRAARLRATGRQIFTVGGTAMGLSAALALFFLANNGLPQRLRPDLRKILAEEEDHEPRIDTCFGLTAADVRAGRLCRIGIQGGKPSFLLWGDSHADAILPAIAEVAAQEHRTGLFAGGRSCPPLVDTTTPQSDCRAFNDAVLELAARPDIREVVLEARWAKYAEGSTYGDEPEGRIVLSDDVGSGGETNHAVFARGLERTIDALKGKKIVIVASVPEIGWPVPAVLAREKLATKVRIHPPKEEAYLDRQKFVMADFRRLREDDDVVVVYPHEFLCRSGVCKVSLHGIPLYRDEHHLSVYGARQLAPLIDDVF